MIQLITGRGDGWVDLAAAGTSVARFAQNMGLLGLTRSPLNVVWWSMRWEVWFSIILPVVLVVLAVAGCGPRRRFRSTPWVFAALCVVTSSLQPWAYHRFGLPPSLSRAMLYLPIFGVGVALAAFEGGIAGSRWLRAGRGGWVLTGAAFVLLGARGPLGALRRAGSVDPIVATGLMQGLSIVGVALIVVVLLGWPRAIRSFSARPVDWVGERSYSLYLVHLPLIGLLAALFEVHTARLWFVALCVAVSLAVTVPFFRLVEVPSVRLASHFGTSRTRSAGADQVALGADARGSVHVG